MAKEKKYLVTIAVNTQQLHVTATSKAEAKKLAIERLNRREFKNMVDNRNSDAQTLNF